MFRIFILILFYPIFVSGIFNHEPQDAPGAKYRLTVYMGTLEGDRRVINDAVYGLREKFGPDSYNILSQNCNHFADALCQALINQRTPTWVNRIANVGSYFSCLLPPGMLGDAPVNDEGGKYICQPAELTTAMCL